MFNPSPPDSRAAWHAPASRGHLTWAVSDLQAALDDLTAVGATEAARQVRRALVFVRAALARVGEGTR
jgi:hypothetical protein